MLPVTDINELIASTATSYVRCLLVHWLVQGRWLVRQGEVACELSTVGRYLAAVMNVPAARWQKGMRDALASLLARSPGVGGALGAVVLIPEMRGVKRGELVARLREGASEEGLADMLVTARGYNGDGQFADSSNALTGYSRAMLLQLRIALGEQQRFLR